MKTEKSIPASFRHSSRSYIPATVKRAVWQRDEGKCQYTDSLTKRKCEGRHKLQYDHIWPLALGGAIDLENMRLLCATHNQIEAIRHFSKNHMEKFIPTLCGGR